MPTYNQVYDPEFHPKEVIRRMELGELDIQIIAAFGISKKTFYLWLKNHPEFKEAYDIGIVQCEAAWDRKGVEYMEGDRDKPFRYWIAIKNNKFGWADGKKEQINKTTNVYIDNMNVLQTKNKDELLDLISKKLSHNDSIPQEYRMLSHEEAKVDDEFRESEE